MQPTSLLRSAQPTEDTLELGHVDEVLAGVVLGRGEPAGFAGAPDVLGQKLRAPATIAA
jgi:hypothetical protein